MRAAIFAFLFLGGVTAGASYRPTPLQEADVKEQIILGLNAMKALETPKIREAKALKRQLEEKMGLPRDANGDATRAPTEEELGRLNRFFERDKRGDYTRAVKLISDTVRARDFHLNRALTLSQSYFQIGNPSPSAGVVRYNADSPNLGSTWNWSLRFNAETGVGSMAGTVAWISPESGVVNFRKEAFSSPAMVAYRIFHEGMHYSFALADVEYRMLKLEEEVHINKSALRHVSDFGLSTDEVRFILRNTGLQFAIAREERRRMANGETPVTPHGGFELTPSPSETAEVLGQIDADLAAFDGALARGVTDEQLEAVRAGAQSEFVRDSNRSDLIELIIAWRSARENDAAQPGRDARLRQEQMAEEARAREARILEAARACGFSMTPEGDFSTQGVPVFRIYHEGDPDKARAAFLLLDACLGKGRAGNVPCNDAFEVLKTRWQEPKFKNSMMKWRTTDPFIDGESDEGQCLLELRENWTPKADFLELSQTIERNYEARERRNHPTPPSNPGHPRERPRREEPTPPAGGDRQCYRSNDGREICVP